MLGRAGRLPDRPRRHGRRARSIGMLSAELARSHGGSDRPSRGGSRRAATLPRGGGTIYLATADRWGSARQPASSRTTPGSAPAWSTRRPASRTRTAARSSASTRRTRTRWRPRKRTVHTLTPGMLLRDGRPWIVHGSMGGEIQPQVFAQFVSRWSTAAWTSPRPWLRLAGRRTSTAHLGAPSLTVIESRYHAAVIDGLRALGPRRRASREPWSSGMGHEHAIEMVRDAARPAALTVRGRRRSALRGAAGRLVSRGSGAGASRGRDSAAQPRYTQGRPVAPRSHLRGWPFLSDPDQSQPAAGQTCA